MNDIKQDIEKFKKIIEGETGIKCDWKITDQNKFDEHGNRIRDYDDKSPITNNLYLAAIRVALFWDRASAEMLTARLVISSALAIRLTDKMAKDGILTPYPKDKTKMLFTVNQELGKKLIDKDLFKKAKKIASEYNQLPAQFLQKSLAIGHAKAQMLLDKLEEAGIVGPDIDGVPRKVLKN